MCLVMKLVIGYWGWLAMSQGVILSPFVAKEKEGEFLQPATAGKRESYGGPLQGLEPGL